VGQIHSLNTSAHVWWIIPKISAKEEKRIREGFEQGFFRH